MQLAHNNLMTKQSSRTGETYEVTLDASAYSLPESAAKLVIYIADGAGETQTITRNTPLSNVSFSNVAEGYGKGTITAQDANGNTLGTPSTFIFDMAPYETGDNGNLIVSLVSPNH